MRKSAPSREIAPVIPISTKIKSERRSIQIDAGLKGLFSRTDIPDVFKTAYQRIKVRISEGINLDHNVLSSLIESAKIQLNFAANINGILNAANIHGLTDLEMIFAQDEECEDDIQLLLIGRQNQPNDPGIEFPLRLSSFLYLDNEIAEILDQGLRDKLILAYPLFQEVTVLIDSDLSRPILKRVVNSIKCDSLDREFDQFVRSAYRNHPAGSNVVLKTKLRVRIMKEKNAVKLDIHGSILGRKQSETSFKREIDKKVKVLTLFEII